MKTDGCYFFSFTLSLALRFVSSTQDAVSIYRSVCRVFYSLCWQTRMVEHRPNFEFEDTIYTKFAKQFLCILLIENIKKHAQISKNYPNFRIPKSFGIMYFNNNYSFITKSIITYIGIITNYDVHDGAKQKKRRDILELLFCTANFLVLTFWQTCI